MKAIEETLLAETNGRGSEVYLRTYLGSGVNVLNRENPS
jgi:hypothetical protein